MSEEKKSLATTERCFRSPLINMSCFDAFRTGALVN